MQEKVSISIDKGLLSKVDALIDKRTIKKRSNAFEFVVSEYFKNIVANDVVVLGGSDVKINTKSVLENARKLMGLGIKRVFIVGDNDFDDIKKGLLKLGAEVYIINEKPLRGTAGALKMLESEMTRPFFVIFINIKFDFNIEEMVSLHIQKNSIATIGVTLARKNTIPDNIAIEGDRITAYNKKRNQFINAGIYIFGPKIFRFLSRRGNLDRDVFPKLAEMGELYSYIITENWKYLGK
jgi:NDP-sugar pyrophosphorylase family protein